jgi:hypothetical protein
MPKSYTLPDLCARQAVVNEGEWVNQPVLVKVSFISATTSASITGSEKGIFMFFN